MDESVKLIVSILIAGLISGLIIGINLLYRRKVIKRQMKEFALRSRCIRK